MNSTITAALAQLVQATGRNYAVLQEGERVTLLMPGGGKYPQVGKDATVALMVRLAHAAEGRLAR